MMSWMLQRLGDDRDRIAIIFQVILHLMNPATEICKRRRVLNPDCGLPLAYPFLTDEARSRDLGRRASPGVESEQRAPDFDNIVPETIEEACLPATSRLRELPYAPLIPHREGWTSARQPGDALLPVLTFLARLPFHLTGFAATRVDRWTFRPPHYVNRIEFAGRRGDG